MAALIAHLVIGERVSSVVADLGSSSPVYGAFLLGCILVDANRTCDLDRSGTHLCRGWNRDGSPARVGSVRFLKRLDSLLLRGWSALTEPEKAFAAGYLCHLAADEAWLQVSWDLLKGLGLTAWDDLPVPAEAMLVAFNELSHGVAEDYPAIASALSAAAIPQVFAHVPHEAFRRMWDIAQAYVVNGGALPSYLRLLRAEGRTGQDIRDVRDRVERYGEGAKALVEVAGGIERFIGAGARWSLQTVPQLRGSAL